MSSEETTSTPSTAEDPNDPSLHAHSYTGVFKIERRIRKINDFNVPMRGGIVPAQAGTFVGVLILSLILWFLLIAPILTSIFQQSLSILPFVFILAPPIWAARQIGRPMPNGKTTKGWIRSRLRQKLDDEWHRGGTPIKSRPARNEKVLHITRAWSPDGEGADYIADLTGHDDLYAVRRVPDDGPKTTPSSVDLLKWVTDVEHSDAESARAAQEKADERGLEHASDHSTFGQVHSSA